MSDPTMERGIRGPFCATCERLLHKSSEPCQNGCDGVPRKKDKEDKVVSVVLVGKGDGECLIAVYESGRVMTGRAGRGDNPNQWHPSWSQLDWKENAPIPKGKE